MKEENNIVYSPSNNVFYISQAKVAMGKGKGKNLDLPKDVTSVSDELLTNIKSRSTEERIVPNNGKPEIVSAIVYSASRNSFYNLNAKVDNIPEDCKRIEVSEYQKFKTLGRHEGVYPDDSGMPTIQSTLAYSASKSWFYNLKLGYGNLPDDIVRIPERLYFRCQSLRENERVVSDNEGYPKVETIPKKEIEKAKSDIEGERRKNKRYEIDIESVPHIRSILVENADLLHKSKTLDQLKSLQEKFNEV